jgi:pimeloyl-ACP methyl ester carboxylesterase
MRRYFDLRRRGLPRTVRRGPGYPVARAAFVAASRWFLGARGWPADLAAIRAPLLLIAAARDELMPPTEVAAVAARVPTATCWVAPHAIHVNAYRLDRAGYADRLLGFLAGALDEAPATVGEQRHG